MATATVKVAPLERWCVRAKNMLQRHIEAGLNAERIEYGFEVGIETGSMAVSDGERSWIVTTLPKGIEMVDGQRICEHMLEMD